MKTTFTIAALTAATSLAASAATIATNTNKTTFGDGNYYGFAINLSSSVVTVTPSLPATFDIDSIQLSGRVTGSGNYSLMKIAVYTYVGDSAIGNFVGLSDAQTLGNNTSVAFNFSGVTVSTADTYQYLFVAGDTTEIDLPDNDLGAYQAVSTTSGLSVTNNPPLPSGSGTYRSNGINAWESSYLPVFTFTAVPEPSTALLGALGVLGLFRRRR